MRGWGTGVIYAFTVVLAACLLFLVQPLIAKLILPWFGGASGVWSAALLFFQACVFAGYAYAHGIARCSGRAQALVHGSLLIAACALLPILPAPEWRPTPQANPTVQILLLLTATVGLPALLLSASSPLLQVWYMRAKGSAPPYWLYSLSNFGSLIALLAFPILLEPSFAAPTLAIAWSVAFVAFAALSLIAAWQVRLQPAPAVLPTGSDERAPSATQMALWLLFAACASGLLVSVSAHLSTNLAPIPLLWVLPLALYLLTFILNFGSRRFYDRGRFFPWLAAAIGLAAYLYAQGEVNLHLRYSIPLYLTALFVICMACHGELVYRRPQARYLTRFYLLLALGGALGGAFSALAAPLLFETHLELPLILFVVAELSVLVQWRRRGPRSRVWLVRGALLAGLVGLAFYLGAAELRMRQGYLLVERNFYGVLRLRDDYVGDELQRRVLFHGTINHGYEYAHERYRNVAGSYFSVNSGVGRALLARQSSGPLHVGVIGLGAGVLASYARSQDRMTFYEIDPAIERIAEQYFQLLSRARARGAQIDVVLGDARLSLERQAPQQFDVLAIDAFSSDAIPAHLLTHEAMQTYMRHLRPDGLLAVHISNRYVDLAPVCARAAERLGKTAVVIEEPSDRLAHASVWVLIASSTDWLNDPAFEGAHAVVAHAPSGFEGWTDRFSNVWGVLKF